MQQNHNRVRIMMFEQNQKGLVGMAVPLNQYLASGLRYAQLLAKTQCDMTCAMLTQQQRVREALSNAQTPAQHWDAQQQYSANVLNLCQVSVQTYMESAIELLSENTHTVTRSGRESGVIEDVAVNEGLASPAVKETKSVKAKAPKKTVTRIPKNDTAVKSPITHRKVDLKTEITKKTAVAPVSKEAKSQQSAAKTTVSATENTVTAKKVKAQEAKLNAHQE